MTLFGFDNRYPYTDFHELNLDWILTQMMSLRSEMVTFVNVNTIKYADPLQWNITTQYEQNTLVQDNAGSTYISKIAVPAGVSISNNDYWLKVASFDATASLLKQAIALADDGASTTTTANRTAGELVWLEDVLYEVIRNMNIGDAYVIGGVNPNIQQVSVETLIDQIRTIINNVYGAFTSADDGDSATTTANRSVGDLIWLNNTLYEVIAAMTIGDAYVVGTNISAITLDDLFKRLTSTLDQEIIDRTSADAYIYAAISAHNEGSSTTATTNMTTGDLVWLNGELYQVTADMTAGDTYVVGTNVSTIDIETLLAQETAARVAEDININARIDALQYDSVYYNVKAYGAVGNGIADDSGAIQDAIDAAYAAGGGVVYFPNGTYKVNSIIIGKSKVSMLGENGSVIDITDVPQETDLNYGHHIGIYYKGSKSKVGVVTGDMNVGEYQFSIDNASALAVGDFIELASTTVIIPYQSAATGPYKGEIYEIIDISGNVITLDHGSNFIFTAAEGVDVYKITPCSDFNIDNLQVLSKAGAAAHIDGIYLWLCHNAVVSRCKVLGCDWYSIGVVESFNVDIIENFIRGTWYDGITGTIYFGIAVLNASQWINIIGNQAEVVRHLYVNTGYYNTQIVVGVPRFINVVSNIAKNMMYGGNGVSYAYQHHGVGSEINFIGNIADSCYAGISVEGENVNIVGNIIKNAKYHGILIGNGLYVDHINVEGNHIYPLITQSNTSPDGEPCGSITMNNRNAAYSIKRVTITGNTIEHNGSYTFGINTGTAGTYEDIDISNNNIVATNTSPNYGSIRAGGTNVSIRNNNIKAQYGIQASSTDVTIEGNRIDTVLPGSSYKGIEAGWSRCRIIGNIVYGVVTGLDVNSDCPCLNNTIINCTTPITGSPTTSVNNNTVTV